MMTRAACGMPIFGSWHYWQHLLTAKLSIALLIIPPPVRWKEQAGKFLMRSAMKYRCVPPNRCLALHRRQYSTTAAVEWDGFQETWHRSGSRSTWDRRRL